MAQASPPSKRADNLVDRFAQSQLAQIKYHIIRESTFLELAVCAFFCGAEKQLRKQSGSQEQHSHMQLVALISRIANLSERNAGGLIDAVENLAGKYYLIENIIEQGTAAADVWLNCETEERQALKDIVAKYQNLSMFDLGIEGVNETHQARQRELYAEVDQSVGRLRRRVLLLLLAFTGVSAVVALAMYYFWWR